MDGWWSGESGSDFAQRGLVETLAGQDMLTPSASPRPASSVREALAAATQRLRGIMSRRPVQPAATRLQLARRD
jgi:hypothetical protein